MQITPPVAILGFGVEGKAALKFLEWQCIKDVTICDEKLESVDHPNFQNNFDDLTKFKTIIRSPGVKYDLPNIQEARDAGVFVTSNTDLTMAVAADRTTAITGSNGKTTTTALLAEILKDYYDNKILVGGNDGKPVLERAIKTDYPILLEVSSFQFADIQKSPHISAVLNITPNHLDWHKTLEDYINSKKNLIAHQKETDWAVLNANDEDSRKLAEKAKGNVFWVGEKKGGNWANWIDDELVVNGEKIITKDEIKLKTHPDNIAFAAAIASIHEVPNETIAKHITSFTGVDHRIEFVREIDGVKIFDDSSCTTPESAEMALNQFEEGKVVILLGGSGKNAEFGFLASKLNQKKARAYLYGKEGVRIKRAMEEAGCNDQLIEYNESGDFKEIIQKALSHCQPGDNLLLSPACASFDMFANWKEKGKKFKEIVKSL